MAEKSKKKQGFAALDPKLVSAIARKGGIAAHKAGTAHQFSAEEARKAGSKGGRAVHAKRQEQQDRDEAALTVDPSPEPENPRDS
jgi:uncharacterized protein